MLLVNIQKIRIGNININKQLAGISSLLSLITEKLDFAWLMIFRSFSKDWCHYNNVYWLRNCIKNEITWKTNTIVV